jgi:hypothetical protein
MVIVLESPLEMHQKRVRKDEVTLADLGRGKKKCCWIYSRCCTYETRRFDLESMCIR